MATFTWSQAAIKRVVGRLDAREIDVFDDVETILKESIAPESPANVGRAFEVIVQYLARSERARHRWIVERLCLQALDGLRDYRQHADAVTRAFEFFGKGC